MFALDRASRSLMLQDCRDVIREQFLEFVWNFALIVGRERFEA